jgi:hypothetical protein
MCIYCIMPTILTTNELKALHALTEMEKIHKEQLNLIAKQKKLEKVLRNLRVINKR